MTLLKVEACYRLHEFNILSRVKVRDNRRGLDW
jgi:hypothetical protein